MRKENQSKSGRRRGHVTEQGGKMTNRVHRAGGGGPGSGRGANQRSVGLEEPRAALCQPA